MSQITKKQRELISVLFVTSTAVSIGGWLTYKFFPGFMSFDSLTQYEQVIGITILNDYHTVIIVYLWRFLFNLSGQHGALFVFHQIVYWSSIVIFACLLTKYTFLRVIILLLIGLCPPLVITSLHVWKDVGMMLALGLASTALLGYIQRPHWAWIALSLFALFYAAAVRVNGFIPAVFLLVATCYLPIRRLQLSRLRTVALTSVFVLGTIGAHVTAMRLVNSQAQSTYALGTLLVWDMVAISLAENTDYLPRYLSRIESTEILLDLQRANNNEKNYPVFSVVSPFPPEQYQGMLFRDWRSLIFQKPFSYLRHRSHVFLVMLGLGNRQIHYPYHFGIDKNEYGLQFERLSLNNLRWYLHKFEVLSRSIFYRPWVYFVVSAIVICLACIRLFSLQGKFDQNVISAIIAMSGLSSALSLFFLAPAADLRYMTWMMFSALMSAGVLGRDYWRSWRGHP